MIFPVDWGWVGDGEGNLFRQPRGGGIGGDEVGKAGGYLVCHFKEFAHYEGDWKALKDFKFQGDTHTSQLVFGGIYFTTDLQEE